MPFSVDRVTLRVPFHQITYPKVPSREWFQWKKCVKVLR